LDSGILSNTRVEVQGPKFSAIGGENTVRFIIAHSAEAWQFNHNTIVSGVR
jgi:hypothetical protein